MSENQFSDLPIGADQPEISQAETERDALLKRIETIRELLRVGDIMRAYEMTDLSGGENKKSELIELPDEIRHQQFADAFVGLLQRYQVLACYLVKANDPTGRSILRYGGSGPVVEILRDMLQRLAGGNMMVPKKLILPE